MKTFFKKNQSFLRRNLKLNKILSCNSGNTGSTLTFRNIMNFYWNSYHFQRQQKSKLHWHRWYWCPAHVSSLNFQLLAPAYLPLSLGARSAKEYPLRVTLNKWLTGIIHRYPNPLEKVTLRCVFHTGLLFSKKTKSSHHNGGWLNNEHLGGCLPFLTALLVVSSPSK